MEMIQVINHINQVLFTIKDNAAYNGQNQKLLTLEGTAVKNQIGQTLMTIEGKNALSISNNKAIGSCENGSIKNVSGEEIAKAVGSGSQTQLTFAACTYFLLA
jgi:hypothetical protein